jgi:hypothetical protein
MQNYQIAQETDRLEGGNDGRMSRLLQSSIIRPFMIPAIQQAPVIFPELPQKFPQHFPRKVAPTRPFRHFSVLDFPQNCGKHCGLWG